MQSLQHRLRSGLSSFSLIAFALVGLLATSCGAAVVTAETERSQVAPTTSTNDAPSAAVQDVTEPALEEDSVVVDEDEPPTTTNPATANATAAPQTVPDPTPTPTPHPIAVADTELPAAPIGFDSLFEGAPAGPQPIAIEIENINVRDAAIIPVGVNQEDLSFEVPPADQVGWYEFGSAPGEAGSAVLAAHIAFNGVDGVFRYLENVEVGAVVVVSFDDGSTLRYRIENVTEYDKEALPESLWARDGREQLALITCGGAFNYQLDSYESNTVAIAVPV